MTTETHSQLASFNWSICNLLRGPYKRNEYRKVILSALSERDEAAQICRDSKGNPEPDPDLRDTETVPLKERIKDYFKREVLPHLPDAWIDHGKTKIGYEVPARTRRPIFDPRSEKRPRFHVK